MSKGISDAAFDNFKKLLYDEAGIVLGNEKRTMVANRLVKRLRALNMDCYDDYFAHVSSRKGRTSGELQHVIDKLTTHKTYFFREPQHFDLLQKTILPQYKGKPLKIWSAACSSGEEVYSLCVLLTEVLGDEQKWHIFGSDISKTEVQVSEAGQYSEEKVNNLSKKRLSSFFTKTKDADGKTVFEIDKKFRKHVSFGTYNLIADAPKKPPFDIIMIRNVLIYFEVERRRAVLDKMMKSLKPGGFLITGRSETVVNLIDNAEIIQPSVFQKK